MVDRKRNFFWPATEEARHFHKVVLDRSNGIKEIESQAKKAIANKQVGSINIVATNFCVEYLFSGCSRKIQDICTPK